MPHKKTMSPRSSFVSPPPSVQNVGIEQTELEAAIAHLTPRYKQMLVNLAKHPAPSKKAKP